jgi:hypothetical protein
LWVLCFFWSWVSCHPSLPYFGGKNYTHAFVLHNFFFSSDCFTTFKPVVYKNKELALFVAKVLPFPITSTICVNQCCASCHLEHTRLVWGTHKGFLCFFLTWQVLVLGTFKKRSY